MNRGASQSLESLGLARKPPKSTRPPAAPTRAAAAASPAAANRPPPSFNGEAASGGVGGAAGKGGRVQLVRLRVALLLLVVLWVVLLVGTAGWFGWGASQGRPASSPPGAGSAATPAGPVLAASFTGSSACDGCHAAEHRAWQTSQHAGPMQHATPASVLGDFDNARFSHGGITSVFSTRDGKFYARTDGPDGRLADFEIVYTFGLAPLQQYLVALPGGRLQALSFTWDSRPKAADGQRWFRQYPNEKIDFKDGLYWTKRSQNWKFMCADCHSSLVKKGYDAATGQFNTRFAEISVGCEACHGPGSAHAAWAKNKTADPAKGLTAALDERRGVAWRINADTGNAVRSGGRSTDREIEVCAR